MAPGDDDSITLILGFPKKMSQCMRLVASAYLKDSSVKPQYLTIIYHLGTNDGISQKELNEVVPFDKSYISIMVHDMIKIGLIYNDGEGKQHSLHLTDRGRDDVRPPRQEPLRRAHRRGEGVAQGHNGEARFQIGQAHGRFLPGRGMIV